MSKEGEKGWSRREFVAKSLAYGGSKGMAAGITGIWRGYANEYSASRQIVYAERDTEMIAKKRDWAKFYRGLGFYLTPQFYLLRQSGIERIKIINQEKSGEDETSK